MSSWRNLPLILLTLARPGGPGLVRDMPARRALALRVGPEEGARAHRAGHDHPARGHLRPPGAVWLRENHTPLVHSRKTGVLYRREK